MSLPKCVRTFDYIQYDGANGQDVFDAIAGREQNSEVTWTLVSDTGTVLTLNWHGDQDQPYEFTLGQYVVFAGNQGEWQGAPLDPTLFAARYQNA